MLLASILAARPIRSALKFYFQMLFKRDHTSIELHCLLPLIMDIVFFIFRLESHVLKNLETPKNKLLPLLSQLELCVYPCLGEIMQTEG